MPWGVGPTELSDTLTADSPVSVKKIVELMRGMIYKVSMELSATTRTGQPQVRAIFGLDFWDYLNANPKELEDFGEGMKSNSHNSLRGVLEKCDFSEGRNPNPNNRFEAAPARAGSAGAGTARSLVHMVFTAQGRAIAATFEPLVLKSAETPPRTISAFG